MNKKLLKLTKQAVFLVSIISLLICIVFKQLIINISNVYETSQIILSNYEKRLYSFGIVIIVFSLVTFVSMFFYLVTSFKEEYSSKKIFLLILINFLVAGFYQNFYIEDFKSLETLLDFSFNSLISLLFSTYVYLLIMYFIAKDENIKLEISNNLQLGLLSGLFIYIIPVRSSGDVNDLIILCVHILGLFLILLFNLIRGIKGKENNSLVQLSTALGILFTIFIYNPYITLAFGIIEVDSFNAFVAICLIIFLCSIVVLSVMNMFSIKKQNTGKRIIKFTSISSSKPNYLIYILLATICFQGKVFYPFYTFDRYYLDNIAPAYAYLLIEFIAILFVSFLTFKHIKEKQSCDSLLYVLLALSLEIIKLTNYTSLINNNKYNSLYGSIAVISLNILALLCVSIYSLRITYMNKKELPSH